MATIAEMTREGVLKGEVAKTAHFRLKINWCAAPKSVPTLWQPPLGNSVKEKLEEKHVQGGTTICCNQFGVREESRPKTTKKQKTTLWKTEAEFSNQFNSTMEHEHMESGDRWVKK